MPRGKANQQVDKVNRDRVWNGFIRSDMTEKDVHDFNAWDVGFDEAFGELAELLTSFKLSVAYHHRNQCYIASLTGTDADRPEHGWCLSAFAGSLVDAVRVLWFKHSVMFGGKWDTTNQKRTRGSIG